MLVRIRRDVRRADTRRRRRRVVLRRRVRDRRVVAPKDGRTVGLPRLRLLIPRARAPDVVLLPVSLRMPIPSLGLR
jgi:hypothetical protein